MTSPKTKAEKTETTGKLAQAGQSGDPAVQFALAELQTAQMNRESLQATDEAAVKKLNEDLEAADAQVKAKQDALAALGYE